MGESLLSLGGCVCVFSSFHMEIFAGTDSSSSAGRGWDGSKSERRALLGLPPRRAGPGWKENRGGKWIFGRDVPHHASRCSPQWLKDAPAGWRCVLKGLACTTEVRAVVGPPAHPTFGRWEEGAYGKKVSDLCVGSSPSPGPSGRAICSVPQSSLCLRAHKGRFVSPALARLASG